MEIYLSGKQDIKFQVPVIYICQISALHLSCRSLNKESSAIKKLTCTKSDEVYLIAFIKNELKYSTRRDIAQLSRCSYYVKVVHTQCRIQLPRNEIEHGVDIYVIDRCYWSLLLQRVYTL